MSQRFSEYFSFLDYFDKLLIVLSVTTGGISIASFATVFGGHVGITNTSFSLVFSISTGIVKKKLLKTTRNKKKKHNMLVRSKLNSIESKISAALINNKISHKAFMTIIKEGKILRTKRKYQNDE